MKRIPLISVITVVWNSEKLIEKTILSVISQQNVDLEYIIIDGASTDSTIGIINKYNSRIFKFISEKDSGIYDAMNKGINEVTGLYVNYMNAGDEFFGFDTCFRISEQLNIAKPDILYGDHIAKKKDTNIERYVKAKQPVNIWKGMFFCHQSCFIRTSVLKDHLFETRYKLAADYNQIVNLYLTKHSFSYFSIPISRIEVGGLAYSNNKTIIEQLKIVYKHNKYSLKLIHFILPLCSNIIKKIIGERLTNNLRILKWRLTNFKMPRYK